MLRSLFKSYALYYHLPPTSVIIISNPGISIISITVNTARLSPGMGIIIAREFNHLFESNCMELNVVI